MSLPPPSPPYHPSIESDIGRAKDLRAALYRHTELVLRHGAFARELGTAAADAAPIKVPPFDAKGAGIETVAAGTRFPTVAPQQPQPGTKPVDGGKPTAAAAVDAKSADSNAKPRVFVHDIDCLYAAEALVANGRKTLVMDAGSRAHFGGGYRAGCRAQEEELCRRTSLALQAHPRQRDFYPLRPGDAIHVPDVAVIRHGADRGYRLTDTPFNVGIGIVAAYNRPKLDISGTRIAGEAAEHTRHMLRSFFAAAARGNYDAVVCVAVGCGAFRNPAGHVAELFADVVNSAEVRGSGIREVCFAVLDDHNSRKANAEGNFVPFARTLARLCGASVLARDGTDRTAAVVAGDALESHGSATDPRMIAKLSP